MPTRLLSLVILAVPLAAFAGTPRGTVIHYECKQIDPAVSGVSCQFDKGELKFRWHGEPKKMSQAKHERGLYEIHRLGLHFMELGGTRFEVRADGWPKRKVQACIHTKHRPFYEYTCYDVRENSRGEY